MMKAKRILVIDDDEDILAILNIIFQEDGYEIILSNTGEAAYELQLIHPDLILLDVRITGYFKSGAEICRELKSNEQTGNIPVLLLSAEDDLASIAYDCGADSFIPKPFDVFDVLMRVKEFLPL
jgi:two-component system response regulator VicR